nr:MAG TPA: hypothetical protein [Caudoviricetes sp.]
MFLVTPSWFVRIVRILRASMAVIEVRVLNAH